MIYSINIGRLGSVVLQVFSYDVPTYQRHGNMTSASDTSERHRAAEQSVHAHVGTRVGTGRGDNSDTTCESDMCVCRIVLASGV